MHQGPKTTSHRRPYEARSADRPEDWWLQLPHAYWLEGHYKTLSLPAKVMLIIALSRPDGFPMPPRQTPRWYGVSSDSTEEGLRELRAAGLLDVEKTWVKAPKSPTGWTERPLYTLHGSFSSAERRKASLIRNGSVDEGEVGVEDGPPSSGLLAPVMALRQPTIADFYAQPSVDEEFMSEAGHA